jgi:hypothetical protein
MDRFNSVIDGILDTATDREIALFTLLIVWAYVLCFSKGWI